MKFKRKQKDQQSQLCFTAGETQGSINNRKSKSLTFAFGIFV